MTMRFSMFAAGLLAMILSTAAFAQGQSAVQDQTGRQQQRNSRHHGRKMVKMDTNHDGQITREEWKGRDRGFQKADRNNDGIISREEARNGRRQLGKLHLKQMDSNQDKQITRSEWSGDPEAFSRLDKNSDGIITKEEIRGRRRKM